MSLLLRIGNRDSDVLEVYGLAGNWYTFHFGYITLKHFFAEGNSVITTVQKHTQKLLRIVFVICLFYNIPVQ